VFRDAGDATSAKLTLQSSPIVFRDGGDATSAGSRFREPLP
jgi:hypothetical protein